MSEFILSHPDNLPFEALTFLESAINKTPDTLVTLKDILNYARSGCGEIYLVASPEIVGAFFIQTDDDYLNLILFSGENVGAWKDKFAQFILDLLKKSNKNLCFVGRPGLGKMFQDLKPIGTVYKLKG